MKQIVSPQTAPAMLLSTLICVTVQTTLAPANEIRDFSVLNGYGGLHGPIANLDPGRGPVQYYDPYENPALLQGYISIDVTAGVVTDLDLRIGGNSGLHFHGAGLQHQFPGTYYLTSGGYRWRAGADVFLELGIQAATLVGFEGGPLTSSFDRGLLLYSSVSYVRVTGGPYGVEGGGVWSLTEGQLVPRVPEPPALALAALGLAGLVGCRWRPRRMMRVSTRARAAGDETI